MALEQGISKHPLATLVVVCTVIRLLIASLINLGNDEVYYFTYAVLPDWNHFDHPPLVGIFIRLFTFNLHCNSEVFVRMQGIVAAAVNTWLIARCGVLVKNRNTGLIAAVLYNTSVYTSILSGIFILPDSVQLTFWLAALYAMLRCIKATGLAGIRRYLLLSGLFIGLATMSKVHGVFPLDRVSWLYHGRSPGAFQKSLFICIARPHGFVGPPLFSFGTSATTSLPGRFHSERVTVTGAGINLKSFFRTTLGQILYANPFQVVLFILMGKELTRRKVFADAASVALLLWCSLPIIGCTMLVSLFRDTLPHWSGPGFYRADAHRRSLGRRGDFANRQ